MPIQAFSVFGLKHRLVKVLTVEIMRVSIEGINQRFIVNRSPGENMA